ncbi:MAG: hypothetical protein IIA09_14255 [Proteobacteria bacterium]|nr:hypothetical protein [Pseudomonadota bacterium]
MSISLNLGDRRVLSEHELARMMSTFFQHNTSSPRRREATGSGGPTYSDFAATPRSIKSSIWCRE